MDNKWCIDLICESSSYVIILKKDIARKTYLKKRQELSSSKFEEESYQLVQNTIELIKKYKPECIHCFLPIHSKGENKHYTNHSVLLGK